MYLRIQAISHSCLFLFLYCSSIFRTIARFSFFFLCGRVSVTQICNVLANARHTVVFVKLRSPSLLSFPPMSWFRERKLAGSVRVTAGIVSYRHGYKSRTIPSGKMDSKGQQGSMDDPDLPLARRTDEAKPMTEGSLMFIEREQTCPLVTRGLDPFRNFNFRLAGDLLRRSSAKDASGRSINLGCIVSANRGWRRCDHPLRKKTTDVRCPDLIPVRKWRGEGWRKDELSSRPTTQSGIREMKFSMEQKASSRKHADARIIIIHLKFFSKIKTRI